MVGESNQNVFFIQIDASSFAEFEISEFDISRFDCIILRLMVNWSQKHAYPKRKVRVILRIR